MLASTIPSVSRLDRRSRVKSAVGTCGLREDGESVLHAVREKKASILFMGAFTGCWRQSSVKRWAKRWKMAEGRWKMAEV